MKKLVLAVAAAALIPTSVFAADLPSRRAPPVFVPPPLPVFSWTGFYAGINAGYAFNNDHTYALTANDPITVGGVANGSLSPFFRNRRGGFTGGGQIGYNYQLGAIGGIGGGGIVVGLEADAAYVDASRTSDYIGGPVLADTTYRSRTDYVGTVRGRLGYAFDNFLVYGTGGFAYGGVRDSVSTTQPGLGQIYAGARDTIRTGYAFGGGVEYALPTTSFLNVFNSSAVTIKAEYVHYDLGTSNLLVAGQGAGVALATSYTTRIRTQGDIVRAGLNFKFGSPLAAPVVARY